MDVKAGYKQTEVGVIPEDWELNRLGELATIATGNTPPTNDVSNYGDEFLFVGPVDMGDAKFISKTEKQLSKKGFAMSRRFPKGSILFVSIGSTIGKCGIAPVELTSNQQINAIFPSPSFSVDYLFYAVCAAAPRIRAQAGEQAVPIVNKSQFSDTAIAIPPMAEQRAIAAALSDMDSLLDGLDRLIAKKRDLKQAVMQQLLTGRTRLPGFTQEWKPVQLGSLLDRLANGAVYRPTTRDGVPITRIETIAEGKLDYARMGVAVWEPALEQYALRRGDILFSHINSIDHIGKVALVADNRSLYHGMNLLLMRVKATQNATYLYYWLASEPARQLMRVLAKKAVSQASINTSELCTLIVSIPPCDEQDAISAVLLDMDAELAVMEARRDKTLALKQAMMQELLTGRTRLI